VLNIIEALQVPEWGMNFLEKILESFTNHQQMEKRHGMAGLENKKLRSPGSYSPSISRAIIPLGFKILLDIRLDLISTTSHKLGKHRKICRLPSSIENIHCIISVLLLSYYATRILDLDSFAMHRMLVSERLMLSLLNATLKITNLHEDLEPRTQPPCLLLRRNCNGG
jgi:hypothetical protein